LSTKDRVIKALSVSTYWRCSVSSRAPASTWSVGKWCKSWRRSRYTRLPERRRRICTDRCDN